MNICTIKLDTIDSTNRYARAEVESGRLSADGATVFVAARQTGGVGRFGRAWASPLGGLWYTLAWPVVGDVLDGLGLRVGVACVEFVRGLVAEAAGCGKRTSSDNSGMSACESLNRNNTVWCGPSWTIVNNCGEPPRTCGRACATRVADVASGMSF